MSCEKKITDDVLFDKAVLTKLSYGLFVLTARDNNVGGAPSCDNGCIINTVMQIAEHPLRISVAVNKSNRTHDMVLNSGLFAVSVLSESVPFDIFKQFGFQSGNSVDKFANVSYDNRTSYGIRYLPDYTNSVISAKVTESHDCGTHTVFFAEILQAFVLSGEPSVTYKFYFDNIKPKPTVQKEQKSGYVCVICGFVYEGEPLPSDFICPICKHGASDFKKL